MTITIWHNPGCGSSKNALAYLEEKGVKPVVYLYLKEKPGKEDIQAMLKIAKLKARDVLRPGEALGEELGLYDGATDAQILDAMATHAKLIQRPIVISDKGAVIARPKTRIDEIL
jgi:arsenate reductase